MKTDITFLPERKQEELQQLTAFIVKEIQPVMVILFGSHARDKWVDDRYAKEGIYYTYKSDYDILVVTKHDLTAATNGKWSHIEHKTDQFKYSAPVTLIQHGLGFLQKELRAGSYFFTDIIKEGIILHDSGVASELKPGEVDPEQVKLRAKEEYELWHKNAGEFMIDFLHAFKRESYKKAIFELHQATEGYYTAFLLVFTGYKPKIHELRNLRKTAVAIEPAFRDIFPQDTEIQRNRFDRLRKAYIDARYKKDYVITIEDLEYLMLQVNGLKALVERVCWEKLGMR